MGLFSTPILTHPGKTILNRPLAVSDMCVVLSEQKIWIVMYWADIILIILTLSEFIILSVYLKLHTDIYNIDD